MLTSVTREILNAAQSLFDMEREVVDLKNEAGALAEKLAVS